MTYQTLNDFQLTYGCILGSYAKERIENIPFGGMATKVRYYIIL